MQPWQLWDFLLGVPIRPHAPWAGLLAPLAGLGEWRFRRTDGAGEAFRGGPETQSILPMVSCHSVTWNRVYTGAV